MSDIFQVFELTPFYLNVQAVPRPFYLIESFGRDGCKILIIRQ